MTSASQAKPAKNLSKFRIILIAGFAMFSMFFGSGNLVFPLMVGVKSLDLYHTASLGLILTGVFLPFLGLIAMIYYSGNRALFFKTLGAPVAFMLTFAMLSLMGPFGVLPRCVIVAHGGVDLVFGGLPAPLFNGIFLVLTGILSWQKTKIIDIIGTYLTPFLLFGILTLITCGLLMGPAPAPSTLPSSSAAFVIGLDQGYQTMDLLAAFFFSAATVSYIAKALKKNHSSTQKEDLESLSLTACSLGAFSLIIVYLGFVTLGAKFAPTLQEIAPEKLLVVVSKQALSALNFTVSGMAFSFGNYALPLAALVICLACLTTSTILASLFADFLHSDMLQEKIPRSLALVVTLLIGYTFSLMGFSDLATWIANALVIAYPALIAFAIFKIIAHKTKVDKAGEAFWSVLLISIILKGLTIAGILS